MSFVTSLAHVLKHEGGYVNHPSDPGGATNWGITRDTLAQWRDRHVTIEEVQSLSKEDASLIYKANYWDAAKCASMPSGIALIVFDGAVNHGVGGMAKMLQRSAGVSADGAIGPMTLAAVNAAEPEKLLLEIAAQRMRFYGGLPTFNVFGLGWSRRLMDTLRAALNAQQEALS
jgi:lysozyme family protein